MSDQNTIPTGAPATAGATHACKCAPACACECTHTQLDHLGALCNHLEEASTCFVTHPGGFYSDNLRNYNLASEGMHKLPSPCSVTWSSNSSGSNAYQWAVHFLLDDFLEVIAGLFADGRLNAIRQPAPEPTEPAGSGSGAAANDPEVYLAGDFKVQRRGSEEGRYYYELSYVPAALSSFGCLLWWIKRTWATQRARWSAAEYILGRPESVRIE